MESLRTLRQRALLFFAVGIATAPALAATHEVAVRNNVFVPDEITVAVGDTVRWVWEAGNHTVTSGTSCTYDGLYFDALSNSSNPTFEFVIPDGPAEIPYFCRPHCFGGMTGMIHVSNAELIDFVITLDGTQQDPFVETTGAGSGVATLQPDTLEFAWDISFADLEGTQTAAHFHGAAPLCENAGVQIGLPTGSPISGSQILTAQQADDLLAGLWYVNVHTTLHGGGEIRGQVMPTPVLDPIPGPIPAGDVHVELVEVASGLTAPNWGATAPGQAGRLFVSDQPGFLWAIDLSDGSKSVFLDVSARLVPLGLFGPGSYDERGFLGVAFHPSYATNGLLYTYTSEPVAGAADFSTIPGGESANHQSVILEWQVPTPADPNSVVDPNSAREILRIDQPQFNHDGGALAFGPDGMLYIALGDGGGADDSDGPISLGAPMIGHGCSGNGQDTSNPLGSILRIDADGSNSANGQYGIPGDNPFVGVAGLDEIYVYGLRNPFRVSFDSMTGTFYIPDVGQNALEEINIGAPGANYGWKEKEGTYAFVPNGAQSGYITDGPIQISGGLTDPIAEYDHDEGTALVGGFVYRGTRVPQLDGRYLFGDFAQTFSNDGRLFELAAGNVIREIPLASTTFGRSLLGFGQDADGEVYVLANTTGTPFDTTGVVLRIQLRAGDLDGDGDVDFDDLNILLANYGATSGVTGADGDIDGDGDVDFDDLNLLLANYGT